MNNQVSVLDVADYIIEKHNMENKEIPWVRLNKLLYFVQGAYLAETGQKLFPEKILKYPHGPVISEVYHYYKKWSLDDITRSVENDVMTSEQKEIINGVIEASLEKSVSQLIDISRSHQSWKRYIKGKTTEQSYSDKEMLFDFGGK